jgi:hypothetical protein
MEIKGKDIVGKFQIVNKMCSSDGMPVTQITGLIFGHLADNDMVNYALGQLTIKRMVMKEIEFDEIISPEDFLENGISLVDWNNVLSVGK